MGQGQKFLFDTSFDLEQDKRARARKKPPEPTYTAADLAEAEQTGFSRGREDGAEEVRAGVEQAARKALEGLGEQLRTLFATVETESARHEAAALRLAMRVIRKLLPEMERRHGTAEIQAILRDCLERRRTEPRLVIRTSDAVHELVRGCTEELAEELGFEGRLVFLTEEGLGPSDVRVEWADGGLERQVAAVETEIDEILAKALDGGAPARGPDGPLQADPAAPSEAPAPSGPVARPPDDLAPPPPESTIVGASEPPVPLKQEPNDER